MTSPHAIIAGKRWTIPQISRLTQGRRRTLWPRRKHRVQVAVLMVKSKLAMLRGRGVTWLGVRGFSRLGRKKFDAKRKREFRIVRGIFFSKKSADAWSHFLRFKCASHLTLCGRCDEVCWETFQDRSFFDRDLLSAADVHSLLTPFFPPRFTRTRLGAFAPGVPDSGLLFLGLAVRLR